jgi:hypothetical protein
VSKLNGNQNAFPGFTALEQSYANVSAWDGLTKREYFAAMALQGVCAYGAHRLPDEAAAAALDMADALLEALNCESK